MFSKIPHNPDSSSHQSPEADIDVENEELSQSVKDAHVEPDDSEATVNVKENDYGASVVQMAFLQFMTQKVVKATADCPEAMKLLNTTVSQDKE